ncbi:T9SS-dependent M36 family metallopeptidase [Aequorivita marina]|uniref:T9SS-dependent M36 family metallopeptidase n=1 Tax=Aequorivita marina TaxID=3073654 RepID=UPI00287478ED|nr:T9SS-dependent M36 family metallopeptidase [Aequorivita sp. S2608]MDS1297387.1 T9SS-dependent M36 family metallopeptidase [Aequorivita sp. S2608]
MKKITFFIAILAINFSFAQDNSSAVKSYLQNNLGQFSLQAKDVTDLSLASESYSKSLKAYTVYVEQRHAGIKVFNSTSPFILKDGAVVSAKTSFIADLALKVNTETPGLTAKMAISKAAAALGLDSPSNLNLLETETENRFIFSNGNISLENIPVELVYQKVEATETVRLAWDLSIYLLDASHYYSLRVDAVTGDVLETMDWVSECGLPDFSETRNHSETNSSSSVLFNEGSKTQARMTADAQYRVFAIPLRNPLDGPDTIEISPEDATASPFGWHDTNGVAGAEHTITRGNNVYAYLDICDAGSGPSPDGGASLNFDFPFNLPQAPADFRDAAAVQLFYMNNIIHDVTYQYGFDEASGNFQKNNYGNGGNGNDAVRAEGQDGGGTNNANFGTPPDGSNPRMQMYIWTEGDGGPVANILSINSGPLAGVYSGVPAGFGGGIPLDLTADLVLVEDDNSGSSTDPNDGCDNITNGGDLTGKIAVIRRGSCEFGFKVLAAENEGAVAVIVVNNEAGAPPLMAAGDLGCETSIPAFAISDVDGDAIIAELQGANTVNGSINGADVPIGTDGDLDTEIVIHEYGHGISNRLTGGRFNTGCLQNTEQMGEGWSDFFALLMTIYDGDQGEDSRGMAFYASGNPNGIRTHPYSTNFGVNPHTYDDIKSEVAPHGVGSVWAAMLWEMTWDLIDEYGFDPDLYNGTGGNNIALQLVMDGLKLQPCSPGFVDGRDAILEADEIANGGANRCIIWRAFARRGLGLSASQGSTNSKSDGTEAFDLPADCQLGVNDNGSIEDSFIVYPNPSNGQIFIKTKLDVGAANITIYDINGRKVFGQQLELRNITEIDAGSLDSGLYLVQIEADGFTQTTKLVIN